MAVAILRRADSVWDGKVWCGNEDGDVTVRVWWWRSWRVVVGMKIMMG